MSNKIDYGKKALALYRRVMKSHIQHMPNELRILGDLYVKQEFRLHLDKATEDQMVKFIAGWEDYNKQVLQMNKHNMQQVKQALANKEFDSLCQDKFSEEQTQSLNEFKQLIYESEQKRKDTPLK